MVLEVTSSHIIYRGRAHLRINVSDTVFYTEHCDHRWFYFWQPQEQQYSFIRWNAATPSGYHTATLYEGQTYKQENNDLFTILQTHNEVLYGNKLYPLVRVSDSVSYNEQSGRGFWYYIRQSSDSYLVLLYVGGGGCGEAVSIN